MRINGAPAAVNSLAEWLSVLWLTPAMDRLFADSAGARRRFLDRLVLALEPAHAHHAARYEAAMRARNKLLAEPDGADPAWLAALEAGMAEHGAAVAERAGADRRRARRAARRHARRPISRPRKLALEGWADGDLAADLQRQPRPRRRRRPSDRRPAPPGPRRHPPRQGQPAAQSSTGEQKALLLGLVLAHAELVAERRGAPPILLLDEVAAHLDPRRRAALFDRLEGRGQVWMTATEAALFDGIAPASRFHVEAGKSPPVALQPLGWTFNDLPLCCTAARDAIKRRDRS